MSEPQTMPDDVMTSLRHDVMTSDPSTWSDAALAAARVEWAMQDDWLAVVLAIANRKGEGAEAVAARLGRPLDNTAKVTERDGVATIPVRGPIFRYANVFTALSGAVSLDTLARDFAAAVDNPGVKAIVLDMDTPGGMAAGIAEFAAQVRAATDIKPVVAYVGNLCASAGYWIAAAASEIVMAKTADVGSIGVVRVWQGGGAGAAKTIEFVSSQSPNKRLDPTTEAGRAAVQANVDKLAEIFIGDVAAFRGVDRDTVATDFGRGGLLLGADAVAAGMADRLGSYEGVVAELAASRPSPRAAAAAAVSTPKGQTVDLETLRKDHPTVAQALIAEGTAAGAAAETTRIMGIFAMKRPPGHEELVATLMADGKTTPDQAAAQVLAAEMAKGPAALQQLRADESAAATTMPAAAATTAPGTTPEGAAALTPEDKAKAAWDKDANLRAEFGGRFDAYVSYEKAKAGGRFRQLGAKG